MKKYFHLSLIIFLVVVWIPSDIANADELAQFKVAVEIFTTAMEKLDIEKIVDIQSSATGLASYGKNLQNHRIVDSSIRKKRFATYLESFDYYENKWFILHSEVMDNIGIASGAFNIKRKAKEYPEMETRKRWSTTWVKESDEWKLIFYHFEFIENSIEKI